MARRLLSHLLIGLAIFSLTATFFVWVIDATVLNPAHLTDALRKGGVPSAIATILPEKAAGESDNDGGCQNGQQNGQQGCQPQVQSADDKQKEADMKAKIAAVVTPQYVDQKLQAVSTSVITFMKNGSPSPTIDVSDFPAKLRASGVETGDDIDKNFSKPIEINNNGSLNVLPKAYKVLKLAKYIGAVIFMLLLLGEWFVATKGDKLHRIGRVFLHAGFWYTLYWAGLILLPSHLLPRLKDKVQADASTNTLIDAVTKSVQHLFSIYFLSFAIICWVIATALYMIRHTRKHVDKIQSVPTPKRRRS